MAKKFDNALSALNEINENTTETNQTLKDLISQDRKQFEQNRRDKVLEDAKDKKQSPIIKGLGQGASKLGEKTGLLDKLKDMIGMIAGLGALSFLTNLPDIMNRLNTSFEEIAKMMEDTLTTIATLPVIKALLKKPPTPPTPDAPNANQDAEAKKKAEAEAKKKARDEAIRKAKAKHIANKVPDIDPRDMIDAEAEAKARRQKLAKDMLGKGQTVKTDMGEIKMNEKTLRIHDADTKKMLNTDEALKALENAVGKAAKPPVPAPDPRQGKYIAQEAASKALALAQKAGSGVGGALSKTGEVLSNIPGAGLVKGAAKVAGKVAAPAGIAIDAGMGYFDEDYKKAGYGGMDRGGLGLMEGMADVGDFGANLATAIGSGIAAALKGQDFGETWGATKKGWSNDVDMSKGFKDFAVSEKGKYLMSFGRMGSLDPEGTFAKQRQEQAQMVGEDTAMAQAIPAYNGPKGAAQAPAPNPKLERSEERNELISQIIRAQNPEKQAMLLGRLEELIAIMTVGEQQQAAMIINQVNQNGASGTVPLSVDIPTSF